jgi:hypothetical protein
MTFHLVVTRSFLNFVKGDIIADVSRIGEILASDHKKFVTKVAVSSTPKG